MSERCILPDRAVDMMKLSTPFATPLSGLSSCIQTPQVSSGLLFNIWIGHEASPGNWCMTYWSSSFRASINFILATALRFFLSPSRLYNHFFFVCWISLVEAPMPGFAFVLLFTFKWKMHLLLCNVDVYFNLEIFFLFFFCFWKANMMNEVCLVPFSFIFLNCSTSWCIIKIIQRDKNITWQPMKMLINSRVVFEKECSRDAVAFKFGGHNPKWRVFHQNICAYQRGLLCHNRSSRTCGESDSKPLYTNAPPRTQAHTSARRKHLIYKYIYFEIFYI